MNKNQVEDKLAEICGAIEDLQTTVVTLKDDLKELLALAENIELDDLVDVKDEEE